MGATKRQHEEHCTELVLCQPVQQDRVKVIVSHFWWFENPLGAIAESCCWGQFPFLGNKEDSISRLTKSLVPLWIAAPFNSWFMIFLLKNYIY